MFITVVQIATSAHAPLSATLSLAQAQTRFSRSWNAPATSAVPRKPTLGSSAISVVMGQQRPFALQKKTASRAAFLVGRDRRHHPCRMAILEHQRRRHAHGLWTRLRIRKTVIFLQPLNLYRIAIVALKYGVPVACAHRFPINPSCVACSRDRAAVADSFVTAQPWPIQLSGA